MLRRSRLIMAANLNFSLVHSRARNSLLPVIKTASTALVRTIMRRKSSEISQSAGKSPRGMLMKMTTCSSLRMSTIAQESATMPSSPTLVTCHWASPWAASSISKMRCGIACGGWVWQRLALASSFSFYSSSNIASGRSTEAVRSENKKKHI